MKLNAAGNYSDVTVVAPFTGAWIETGVCKESLQS